MFPYVGAWVVSKQHSPRVLGVVIRPTPNGKGFWVSKSGTIESTFYSLDEFRDAWDVIEVDEEAKLPGWVFVGAEFRGRHEDATVLGQITEIRGNYLRFKARTHHNVIIEARDFLARFAPVVCPSRFERDEVL
jgi:hypothetical protein